MSPNNANLWNAFRYVQNVYDVQSWKIFQNSEKAIAQELGGQSSHCCSGKGGNFLNVL